MQSDHHLQDVRSDMLLSKVPSSSGLLGKQLSRMRLLTLEFDPSTLISSSNKDERTYTNLMMNTVGHSTSFSRQACMS
jgi:hypothetical protein